jgi:hypothetical protein
LPTSTIGAAARNASRSIRNIKPLPIARASAAERNHIGVPDKMNEETILKSTRHQKIIGDFGEQFFCNWLSRSGLEVAKIDHTGIDVIAALPDSKRIGISVKSRTRTAGKESDSVNLLTASGEDRRS